MIYDPDRESDVSAPHEIVGTAIFTAAMVCLILFVI